MMDIINEISKCSEYNIVRTLNNRIIVFPKDINISIVNNVLTRYIMYKGHGLNVSFDIHKLGQAGLEMLHGTGLSEYCQILSDATPVKNIIRVLPITEINSNKQAAITIAKIYESIDNCLNNYINIKEDYVSDIAVTLGEVVQNIPMHSEGVGIIYIFATQENSIFYLNCGIADNGIGIKNSLKEYQSEYRHFWNDSFAITLALQKGVSRFRKTESGRGKGLSGLYNRVQKWGGMLHIASGRGVFIYQNQNYDTVELKGEFFGVQICLKMPINNFQ